MQTLPTVLNPPNDLYPADAEVSERPFEPSARVRVFRMVVGLLLLILLLALGTARAQASAAPGTGSLHYMSDDGPVEATRVATDVSMTVNGLIARVTVSQSFRNDSTQWVEALYLFPLPETGAVDQLFMVVGDREIVGEIQPRAQAQATFKAAKAAGHKASLVEYERANLFRTSVANLGPGEVVTIDIEYQQRVDYDQGVFSLRFPMAITPRFTPSSADSPPAPDATTPRCVGSACARASVRIALTPGFALDTLDSPTHQIDVHDVGAQQQISLLGGDTVMDRDFELRWRAASGSEPQAVLFTEQRNGDHYGLVLFVPPHQRTAPAQGRELILVIDTSGSMGGTSILQARQALNSALDRLTPADRFNIVAFSNHAESLFLTPQDVSQASLQQARRYVNQLRADGGTNMQAALESALVDGQAGRADDDGLLRQVVFITDGSVANEEQLFALIHRHLDASRLFTVGIGAAPNSYFMRKAASFGRGSFTHIATLTQVGEKMDGLLAKLESPALTDLAIDWSVALAEPEQTVRDLYFGEPVLLTTRLKAPPQMLRVSAAGGFSQTVYPAAVQASGVATLWARERIDRLMDERLRSPHRDVLETQITALALEHHVVTAFTSLVAVERSPSRPLGAPLEMKRVESVLPAGMNGQQSGYPVGATSSRFFVLLGLLALFTAWRLGRERSVA
ncbi:MAG: marine proteobacterial sortase target protein [Gammaproteobacteria bacterium]